MADFEGVAVVVGERGVDGPLEGSASRSGGQRSDGVQVSTITHTEDEGRGRVVGGRVLDRVRLSDLGVRGPLVDFEGQDGGKQGSARNDGREETHVDDDDEVLGIGLD